MEHVVPTANDPSESNGKVMLQGLLMILFSEIGDKTFLIAAILAMRHPRAIVFAGAFGALALMSVLSAVLGHVLPTLIPKSWTQLAAAGCFFVFGARMFQEGREMEAGSGKIREEMREAEEEIEEDDAALDGTGAVVKDGHVMPLEEMEEGGRARPQHVGNGSVDGRKRSRSISKSRSTGREGLEKLMDGARNFFSLLLGPVFVQAFALTFLGEWGDRSQIATIALGAAHNIYIVSLSTIIGHACCTGVAVIGGRYISTKISVKHVTLGASVLFLIFGFIYLYEALKFGSDHVIAPDHDDPSDLLH